jgi:signal transduction histidine kinase
MNQPALEAAHVRAIYFLRITLASLGLFSIAVSYAGANQRHDEWLALPWHTLYLSIVTLVLACWINSECLLKRRLATLNDLCQLRHAHNDSNKLLGAGLERLRKLYAARYCFVVIQAPHGGALLHLADNGESIPTPSGMMLANVAKDLRYRSSTAGFAYGVHSFFGLTRYEQRFHAESTNHESTNNAILELQQLFRSIGPHALVTASMRFPDAEFARIYVISPSASFNASDIQFLQQATDQLACQLEHLRLREQIASTPARAERRQISLDLHDSTIQPYLGLKIGLEALRRKAGANSPLASDLDELCLMTSDSIAELRRYVDGLKERPDNHPINFRESIAQQAEKFRKFYGIDVQINVAPDLNIDGRLATEILQIASESLSNIGRHTKSPYATINLFRQGENLITQAINQSGDTESPETFTPKSISERAAHLGGRVVVSNEGNGATAVTVTIPC